MKVRFSLAVAVCLFLISVAQAQTNLRVDETETKAVFTLNQLRTSIVAENPAQSFAANMRLEVLDADDKILAQTETREKIKRGRQTLEIPLEFALAPDANNLLWYRLRYSIVQENSSNSASGIVSLSEIMPELYELQIVASENFYAGMRLRAHVIAVHPLTKKPIKNVNLTGEVVLDLDTNAAEDKLRINAAAKTNDEGYATLDFEIPQTAKLDDDGEIKIRGEKNGITREAGEDLNASKESRVYLMLDKPIYQPNQKLYVRGLFLNPARRPLADRDLDLEITDEEDETVFEKTVKTSRFGAASVEWQIPDSIKLGKYKIEVKNSGGAIGASEFKITRYDLPNFTVETNADKTYYLPEQKTAEITVGAAYLFGKPVTKGAVKIVRETERKWNYAEQKWETEEAKTYTGEADADGKFVAQIDLSEAHAALRGDAWKRFEDLHFAAYFTDATTNRTEVKRFDVRVTKEAIHIYFLVYNSDVNRTIPFQFYVSTFYADGTPARCRVVVKGNYQESQEAKILAESKTGAYGASRFEIRIPEKPFAEAKDRFDLQITAGDKNGNVGNFADSIYLDEKEKQIRIATDKTVYFPNENIEAKIYSTEPDKTIYLDVLKNSSVVYSKSLRLEDGRGSLLVPFQPDFKGELVVSAYYKDEDGFNDAVSQSKAIIYPAADNLKLSVKSLKTVYRPNEEATVNFSVRNGAGEASETALGVTVLDKAVEERSQDDRQAFDNYKDLRELSGTADSFGNLTRRDLNNLDLTKPVGEDLQLAAEFLLVNKTYEPRFFESDSYESNFRRIYKDYFAGKLEAVENSLKNNYEKSFEFPADEASLKRILKTGGINFDDLRDAWGTPYAVEFKIDRKFITVALKTASADKKHGTADDFTAKEMQFEWFAKTQNALTVALNNYMRQTKNTPKTTDELQAVWNQAGFGADALRDGWNRPLYLTEENYKRNTQKVVLENIGNLDGEIQQVARKKVVSQDTIFFSLRSAGADGAQGNGDDFDVSGFTVVISEKPLTDELALATISKSKTATSSGAITGTLFDPNGAVVPGVIVAATNQNSAEVFSAASNDEGVYLLANLPSGKYRVEAKGQNGFTQTTIENVVVSSMNLIKLDVTLQVAGVSSTVDVTAESAIVDSSSSSVSVTKKDAGKSISARLNSANAGVQSTPRVREYFPETLLWSPDIITDKNGNATLKFKLADSLTTWKLYAVGSTETGEVGLVEKEIRTFQPFFAELNPPRMLTEGDRIALPVPVRNYTDKRQKVSISMAENNWSSLANDASRQIEIEPNASRNATFDFRAVAPVKEGKQKITALAKGESDAIEKPVTVRPSGREIVETQSKLFRGSTEFNLNFPSDAFRNTRRAELKIYPNMLAHVAESIDGLLQRPHGCGEQTTSSTYPNLMILKVERELKKSIDAKTKEQAQIFLKEGYERLLN